MGRRVTVIYQDGVLRPLSPLELPKHSQVEIDIHQVASAPDRPAHRDQVDQALVKVGLSPLGSAALAGAAREISTILLSRRADF